MKKIKMNKSTVCGGERVAKGETVEASTADANYLIASGTAVDADTKKAVKEKITKESQTRGK